MKAAWLTLKCVLLVLLRFGATIPPYLRGRMTLGRFHVSENLGLRVSLEGEAHDEEDTEKPVSQLHEGSHERPLFVSPHEDRELVSRFGFGTTVGRRGIQPELYIDSAHVLGGESSGDLYLTTGLSVAISLGQRLQLQPSIEVPLSDKQRFEWRTGLAFTARF